MHARLTEAYLDPISEFSGANISSYVGVRHCYFQNCTLLGSNFPKVEFYKQQQQQWATPQMKAEKFIHEQHSWGFDKLLHVMSLPRDGFTV